MNSCHSCAVKTKHHSWMSGTLAKGCQLCVKGEKLVLFITGLCGQKCFYCPVSERKFGSDVVFANEWKISNPDNPVELLEEARLTRATGAGITGGDPLVKVGRCCHYIKLLKRTFGKSFHTHLYTPLMLVNEENIKRLYEAGLDEIRFHPDLDDKWWHRIELARKYKWDVGIEIPAIPDYEEKTRTLIDFIADKVMFINLNELEISDTQAAHYKMDPKKFVSKDSLSYGVKGSQEMALKMVNYAHEKNLSAHFCTAKLKDSVQVGERLKRRAKSIALPDETITEDGTIIRGCIYLKDTVPSFGYRKRLNETNKKPIIEKLNYVMQELVKNKIFKRDEIRIDEIKIRLITSEKNVQKSARKIKELNLVPAIIEEYPTADALEIDVQFV